MSRIHEGQSCDPTKKWATPLSQWRKKNKSCLHFCLFGVLWVLLELLHHACKKDNQNYYNTLLRICNFSATETTRKEKRKGLTAATVRG